MNSSEMIRSVETALADEFDAVNAASGLAITDGREIKVSPTDVSLTPIGSSASSSSVAESSGASTPNCERKSATISCAKSVNSELEELPPRCGWCCWKPECLQKTYNYKTALLLMCCFAFLQGVVVNGLTPLNTGSLERRFGLTSVQTGWLNSAYDLAAATATVFLSYLADRRNKPRWLMFSAICFTIGSLTFALPHFIAAPYSGGVSQTPLCFAKASSSSAVMSVSSSSVGSISVSPSFATLTTTSRPPQKQHCDSSDDSLTTSPAAYWRQVLLVGQIIMGVGGAVIYTVGVAFIDDWSEQTASGLHIGITFLSTAVGAAAGYGAGSALLTLSVNFNRPDWPQFKRQSADPNYVGAWWFGYLICSSFFAFVALGFSCFDYEMPETARLRLQRVNETHTARFSVRISGKSRLVTAIVDFINSLLKLVTNPVLVCVTLALVSHALFSQGTQPFFVKIIENQFHVSESKAGFVVGAIIIIGISSATLGSGYLMKRFEMTVRGTLMMISIFVFLSCTLSLCLLMHCDPERIVGINTGYDTFGLATTSEQSSPSDRGRYNLASTCNSACNCSAIVYRPVCHRGTDVQFFSACHAGCRAVKRLSPNDPSPIFTNCTCLERRQDLMADAANNTDMYSLRPGICEKTCPQFFPAMILMFLLLFCGFATSVPLTGVVMRCVHAEDRSMALAFNQSVERFLGNIPGPLLIGRIIDLSCIFRREYCNSNNQGACFTYDSRNLSVRLTTLCVGLNFFAFVLYMMAFLLYKPPSGQTISEYFLALWQGRSGSSKKSSTTTTTITNSSVSTFTYINNAHSEVTLVSATASPLPPVNNNNTNENTQNNYTEAHVNPAYSSCSSLDTDVNISFSNPVV